MAEPTTLTSPQPPQPPPSSHSPPAATATSTSTPTPTTTPTTTAPSKTSPAHKRPSSPSPPSPKRTRLTQHSPPPSRPAPTKSQDDKSRTRRLFGSLLTTLAQPSQRPRAVVPRRILHDVDVDHNRDRGDGTTDDDETRKRRRKEQDQEQDERVRVEDQKRREVRWRGWEGEVIRIRHQTLLTQAKFLRTRAEPRVFYKPHLLSRAQQDAITTQISDAESLIARELRGGGVTHPSEAAAVAAAASREESKSTGGGEEERSKDFGTVVEQEGEDTGGRRVVEVEGETLTAERREGDQKRIVEGEVGGKEEVMVGEGRRLDDGDGDGLKEVDTDTDMHAYAHEVLLEGEEDNVIY